MVLNSSTLRFWENKGWINEIDPYEWFQQYFRYWWGEKAIQFRGKFRGKLVKMVKDAGSKFGYSVSPKIRQLGLLIN